MNVDILNLCFLEHQSKFSIQRTQGSSTFQYKAGRELIRSATNSNGVVEIMKKLILTMSLDNCVFNLLDSSLHPQTIISELLREIIVSGNSYCTFDLI